MIYIQEKTIMIDDSKFPLIAIKDLTRWYPDSKKPLFKKLNFELFKWEFTVIIGKSGVWKSTIVKFLIWQFRPYTRTVYYRMDDMAHYTDEDIQRYRRKIWIVFQDYKLIDALSVKENIVYPLRIQWDDDITIQAKYRNITSKLHIEDINKLDCNTLSGWEKQKVAIARAMVNNPEFIIADEPTWNLDWEYTQEIGDLLVEANNSWNTILLITHDVHLLNYIKSKTNVNVFQLW
jgi:cell division transport system ATP-binding protein